MTAARGTVLLEVQELTIAYGESVIVKEVSLTVGVGETVLVVGANGSGKSTLMKGIVGELRPQTGKVLLDGRNIAGLPTNQIVKSGIGFVPQDRAVFEPLSVGHNLEMAAYQLHGKQEVEDRIAAVLNVFPLLQRLLRRRASTLSGGEKRVLALAMVMLYPRRLLILDEPSAALAPSLAEQFLVDQVGRIAEAGTAVLMIEQRVEAALKVANWLYVMRQGRIEQSGSPETLAGTDSFRRSLTG